MLLHLIKPDQVPDRLHLLLRHFTKPLNVCRARRPQARIDPRGYINLSVQWALRILIRCMENIHVPHSEVRERQLQ